MNIKPDITPNISAFTKKSQIFPEKFNFLLIYELVGADVLDQMYTLLGAGPHFSDAETHSLPLLNLFFNLQRQKVVQALCDYPLVSLQK